VDVVDHNLKHQQSPSHLKFAGHPLMVVAFRLAPSQMVRDALSPRPSPDPMLSAHLQQTTPLVHPLLEGPALLLASFLSLPTLDSPRRLSPPSSSALSGEHLCTFRGYLGSDWPLAPAHSFSRGLDYQAESRCVLSLWIDPHRFHADLSGGSAVRPAQR